MKPGDDEFAHLAFGGVESSSLPPEPHIAFREEAFDLGPRPKMRYVNRPVVDVELLRAVMILSRKRR